VRTGLYWYIQAGLAGNTELNKQNQLQLKCTLKFRLNAAFETKSQNSQYRPVHRLLSYIRRAEDAFKPTSLWSLELVSVAYLIIQEGGRGLSAILCPKLCIKKSLYFCC